MLIDSNILIYALNASSPKHIIAQAFLQAHAEEMIFAQQNIFETLRILTHTKFPTPFSPDNALKAVQALVNHAQIITPTPETAAIAFELTRKYQITGAEIFDAYLVATALSNDVETIATDNVKHLSKYQEVEVVWPF